MSQLGDRIKELGDNIVNLRDFNRFLNNAFFTAGATPETIFETMGTKKRGPFNKAKTAPDEDDVLRGHDISLTTNPTDHNGLWALFGLVHAPVMGMFASLPGALGQEGFTLGATMADGKKINVRLHELELRQEVDPHRIEADITGVDDPVVIMENGRYANDSVRVYDKQGKPLKDETAMRLLWGYFSAKEGMGTMDTGDPRDQKLKEARMTYGADDMLDANGRLVELVDTLQREHDFDATDMFETKVRQMGGSMQKLMKADVAKALYAARFFSEEPQLAALTILAHPDVMRRESSHELDEKINENRFLLNTLERVYAFFRIDLPAPEKPPLFDNATESMRSHLHDAILPHVTWMSWNIKSTEELLKESDEQVRARALGYAFDCIATARDDRAFNPRRIVANQLGFPVAFWRFPDVVEIDNQALDTLVKRYQALFKDMQDPHSPMSLALGATILTRGKGYESKKGTTLPEGYEDFINDLRTSEGETIGAKTAAAKGSRSPFQAEARNRRCIAWLRENQEAVIEAYSAMYGGHTTTLSAKLRQAYDNGLMDYIENRLFRSSPYRCAEQHF